MLDLHRIREGSTMIKTSEVISMIRDEKERYSINGSLDAQEVCRGIGVDINVLVFVLVYIIVMDKRKIAGQEDRIEHLECENKVLENCLAETCRGDGRLKQIVKVSGGMPIAKRKKKDLSYLRLAIRLGATDKELMKDIGISRTTLWRWKKEMNERLKSGNGRGVL
jgi:hypothetical protein